MSENNQIQILPVNPKHYHHYPSEEYMQRGFEFQDFDRMLKSKVARGILIVGPSGVGKTLSIGTYAREKNYPYLSLSCHSNITQDELLGTPQIVNGNSSFNLGTLPVAIEIANNDPSGVCVLNLDEVNTMTPDQQKILNEYTDFDRGITVPQINRHYKLKPGKKILLAMTCNNGNYAGTYELNREFLSRIIVQQWDQLPDAMLSKLMKEKNIDKNVVTFTLTFKTKLEHAVKNDNLEQAIDGREIMKFCESINLQDGGPAAVQRAIIECFRDKFSISANPEHIRLVAKELESVYGSIYTGKGVKNKSDTTAKNNSDTTVMTAPGSNVRVS